MASSSLSFKASFSPAMTKQHWGVGDDFSNPTAPTLAEIEVLAARNEVVGVQVHLAGSQDFTLVLDRANWLHQAARQILLDALEGVFISTLKPTDYSIDHL